MNCHVNTVSLYTVLMRMTGKILCNVTVQKNLNGFKNDFMQCCFFMSFYTFFGGGGGEYETLSISPGVKKGANLAQSCWSKLYCRRSHKMMNLALWQ